jgi:hypothetical protein
MKSPALRLTPHEYVTLLRYRGRLIWLAWFSELE